jgi:hypothetical protein
MGRGVLKLRKTTINPFPLKCPNLWHANSNEYIIINHLIT